MEKNVKKAKKEKSKEKSSPEKSESEEDGIPCPSSGFFLLGMDIKEKTKSRMNLYTEYCVAWKKLDESEQSKWNEQAAKLNNATAAKYEKKAADKKAGKKAAAPKAPKDDDKNDKRKRSLSKNKKKQVKESDEEADDEAQD